MYIFPFNILADLQAGSYHLLCSVCFSDNNIQIFFRLTVVGDEEVGDSSLAL